MKLCTVCQATETKRWIDGKCSKCYMKEYRIKYGDKRRLPEHKAKLAAQGREYRMRNKDKRDAYEKYVTRRFAYGRRNASTRHLEWSLTIEEYSDLIVQPCHYCNNELGDPVEKGVGLDRIDNGLGYVVGNVISCCTTCNLIRGSALSKEEMESVAKHIISLRRK